MSYVAGIVEGIRFTQATKAVTGERLQRMYEAGADDELTAVIELATSSKDLKQLLKRLNERKKRLEILSRY